MLVIRLLGEMELIRDGEPLSFPPSRRTRALLAYLVATGRSHRREHLCELFWEIPDDPRGALRWSLSRIRKLVNDESTKRIVTSGETVAFAPTNVEIDLVKVRTGTEDLAALSSDELTQAADLFRGDFLEGSDIPDLHEFQAWCLAEREDLRRLRASILKELIERNSDEPDAALPHVRQLVQIEPYNTAGRVVLLRHLVALGRNAEAVQHFEAGIRAAKEVDPDTEIALLQTWRELHPPKRRVVSPVITERKISRFSLSNPKATADTSATCGEAPHANLTGQIRVTAAPSTMNHWVFPILSGFRALHPAIQFETNSEEERVSLEDGVVHVAFRAADEIAGGALVARKLPPVRWGIYCSKSYLLRYGMPHSEGDLKDHFFLSYPTAMVERSQLLSRIAQHVDSDKIVSAIDSVVSMAASLKIEQAVGALPCAEGDTVADLVCCFTSEAMYVPLWIVASKEAFEEPRVREFMEFAVEHFPENGRLMPR